MSKTEFNLFGSFLMLGVSLAIIAFGYKRMKRTDDISGEPVVIAGVVLAIVSLALVVAAWLFHSETLR